MIGNVETISQQNNACKIDGVWYSFGPNVKLQYVKKGPCEFNVEVTPEGQNDLVVFIKATQAPFNTSPPKPQNAPQNPLQSVTQDGMQRMSALKSASRIFQGTGQEEDFKRLTDEVRNYIEQGFWVENVKV